MVKNYIKVAAEQKIAVFLYQNVGLQPYRDNRKVLKTGRQAVTV
jgi:hypothetical protein